MLFPDFQASFIIDNTYSFRIFVRKATTVLTSVSLLRGSDIESRKFLSSSCWLPNSFLYPLLEYAKYMKELAEKGEKTDMEYLTGIPGMVDLIKESAKADLNDCTDKIEW